MHQISVPRLAMLAACTALVGVSALLGQSSTTPSSANKSTFKAELTKAPVKVQLDHKDFKHHKRNPIKHKPLEMKDPKTGKPLKADDPIKLPNGTTMKA